MQSLDLFVPITKVEAERRLVYGVVTAECEDRAGEICDYASTKPYYERWSREIEKASEGRSLGNLRAMHDRIAAGKITSLSFDDDARQIEICAKVVDDAEWEKVCEGVYTGFSQGGSYVNRWRDETGGLRYTADPREVSLVDSPCLPSATFKLIKADGDCQERKFKAADDFDKYGARNSGADLDRIQRAHDALVELGAACSGPEKAHASHSVERELAKLTADRDELRKALAGMTPVLDEILRRVKAIESQPERLPLVDGERVVAKKESSEEIAKFVEEHQDAVALEFIKQAHRRPQFMGLNR